MCRRKGKRERKGQREGEGTGVEGIREREIEREKESQGFGIQSVMASTISHILVQTLIAMCLLFLPSVCNICNSWNRDWSYNCFGLNVSYMTLCILQTSVSRSLQFLFLSFGNTSTIIGRSIPGEESWASSLEEKRVCVAQTNYPSSRTNQPTASIICQKCE